MSQSRQLAPVLPSSGHGGPPGRGGRPLLPDADLPGRAAAAHVGVWKHGVSLYGWRDDGFLARHPSARASKGTIRMTPEDADEVTDQELRTSPDRL